MSEQEINVAIAEACGAKWYLFASGFHWISFKHLEGPYLSATKAFMECSRPETLDKIVIHESVPDYCNDLNAMHEAEIKIPLDSRDEYWWRLEEITQKNRMAEVRWTNLTATARQRAEAFLRTLNKWPL